MADEVRNSGNRLTPEEIAARRDAFYKIQENGHEIILTTQSDNPKNSGVSYDYMNRLYQDIDAGIFEDVNQDGFTKQEKKELAKEIESVFTKHGYKTDFKNMDVGETYKITYDEYIKLAKAAGYKLVDNKSSGNINVKSSPESASGQNTEAKAKAKAEAEPKAKAEAEPKAKAEAEPKAKAEAEPKAKAEAEPKAKAEAEPKAKAETEPKAKAEAEPKAKAEAEPKAKAEAEPKAKAEAEPKAKAEAEPKAKAETEPKAKAEAEPKAKAEAEPKAKAEAEPKAKAEAEAKAKAEAEAKAKAEAEAKAKAEAEPKAKAKVTPVYNNAEEELNAFFDNDPELANQDGKGRAAILEQRVRIIESQISDLSKTKETYTTPKILFFGGKTKERELPASVIKTRKAQAEQLQQEKDDLMKYKVYADKVLSPDYWIGTYTPDDLKDDEGRTLKKHGTYNKVTVVGPDSKSHRVLSEKTYEEIKSDQHAWPIMQEVVKYYPIAVELVGDPNIGQRWEVVPDKDHELVGYTQKK